MLDWNEQLGTPHWKNISPNSANFTTFFADKKKSLAIRILQQLFQISILLVLLISAIYSSTGVNSFLFLLFFFLLLSKVYTNMMSLPSCYFTVTGHGKGPAVPAYTECRAPGGTARRRRSASPEYVCLILWSPGDDGLWIEQSSAGCWAHSSGRVSPRLREDHTGQLGYFAPEPGLEILAFEIW